MVGSSSIWRLNLVTFVCFGIGLKCLDSTSDIDLGIDELSGIKPGEGEYYEISSNNQIRLTELGKALNEVKEADYAFPIAECVCPVEKPNMDSGKEEELRKLDMNQLVERSHVCCDEENVQSCKQEICFFACQLHYGYLAERDMLIKGIVERITVIQTVNTDQIPNQGRLVETIEQIINGGAAATEMYDNMPLAAKEENVALPIYGEESEGGMLVKAAYELEELLVKLKSIEALISLAPEVGKGNISRILMHLGKRRRLQKMECLEEGAITCLKVLELASSVISHGMRLAITSALLAHVLAELKSSLLTNKTGDTGKKYGELMDSMPAGIELRANGIEIREYSLISDAKKKFDDALNKMDELTIMVQKVKSVTIPDVRESPEIELKHSVIGHELDILVDMAREIRKCFGEKVYNSDDQVRDEFSQAGIKILNSGFDEYKETETIEFLKNILVVACNKVCLKEDLVPTVSEPVVDAESDTIVPEVPQARIGADLEVGDSLPITDEELVHTNDMVAAPQRQLASNAMAYQIPISFLQNTISVEDDALEGSDIETPGKQDEAADTNSKSDIQSEYILEPLPLGDTTQDVPLILTRVPYKGEENTELRRDQDEGTADDVANQTLDRNPEGEKQIGIPMDIEIEEQLPMEQKDRVVVPLETETSNSIDPQNFNILLHYFGDDGNEVGGYSEVIPSSLPLSIPEHKEYSAAYEKMKDRILGDSLQGQKKLGSEGYHQASMAGSKDGDYTIEKQLEIFSDLLHGLLIGQGKSQKFVYSSGNNNTANNQVNNTLNRYLVISSKASGVVLSEILNAIDTDSVGMPADVNEIENRFIHNIIKLLDDDADASDCKLKAETETTASANDVAELSQTVGESEKVEGADAAVTIEPIIEEPRVEIESYAITLPIEDQIEKRVEMVKNIISKGNTAITEDKEETKDIATQVETDNINNKIETKQSIKKPTDVKAKKNGDKIRKQENILNKDQPGKKQSAANSKPDAKVNKKESKKKRLSKNTKKNPVKGKNNGHGKHPRKHVHDVKGATRQDTKKALGRKGNKK